MEKYQEHIWYASYGSNLLEERFLCYIKGGRPAGSATDYEGCTDKTLPIENKECFFDRELYFAKESLSWNRGGVCFIKTNADPFASTLGRMYLITKEQFHDVLKQETRSTENLDINFNHIINEGSYIVKENSWYGNVIYLGNEKEFPVFTFTNAYNIEEINKPDENYLKLIIRGIRETSNFDIPSIINYLISKQGISGNFTHYELGRICKDVIH